MHARVRSILHCFYLQVLPVSSMDQDGADKLMPPHKIGEPRTALIENMIDPWQLALAVRESRSYEPIGESFGSPSTLRLPAFHLPKRDSRTR